MRNELYCREGIGFEISRIFDGVNVIVVTNYISVRTSTKRFKISSASREISLKPSVNS